MTARNGREQMAIRGAGWRKALRSHSISTLCFVAKLFELLLSLRLGRLQYPNCITDILLGMVCHDLHANTCSALRNCRKLDQVGHQAETR